MITTTIKIFSRIKTASYKCKYFGVHLGGKKTKRLRAYRRLYKKTRRHMLRKRARKNKNNK